MLYLIDAKNHTINERYERDEWKYNEGVSRFYNEDLSDGSIRAFFSICWTKTLENLKNILR